MKPVNEKALAASLPSREMQGKPQEVPRYADEKG